MEVGRSGLKMGDARLKRVEIDDNGLQIIESGWK